MLPSKIRLITVTVITPLMLLNLIVFLGELRMAVDWADFRHLYTAGYMVRTGHRHEIYDYEPIRNFQDRLVRPVDGRTMPFNHLAYEGLLFAPLTLARYHAAFYIFLAINLSLLFYSYWLLRYRFSDLQMPVWFPAALFIASRPVMLALSDGQDSIITFALMAGAALLYERGREPECGALIGLTLYKFQLGIPIILLFLVWRHWRIAAGFACTSVVVLGLSLWVAGPDSFIRYAHTLTSLSGGLTSATQYQYGLYPTMMINLRGLAYGLFDGHISHFTMQLVVALASLVTFIWAASRPPSFSLAITTAVLISYHCFAYEGVLLFIPLSIFIGNILRGKVGMWTSLLVAVLIGAPTILTFTGNFYYLLSIPILILFALLCWPQKNQDFSEPVQAVGNPETILPQTAV